VEAHGGRLDSNGGHFNRATGHYHYHSGPWSLLENVIVLLQMVLIVVIPYLLYKLIYRWKYPHRVINRNYFHEYFTLRTEFVKENGEYPAVFGDACRKCKHKQCYNYNKCDVILQDYAVWFRYKDNPEDLRHVFIKSRNILLNSKKIAVSNEASLPNKI
jgi:hypothetical protein